MRKLLFALVLTISGTAAMADELTDRSVAALKAALPGSEVTVVDSRTLKVRKDKGPELTVALENVGRVCAGDPQACPHVLDDFAHKVAATMAAPVPARSRTQLRAVVRDKSYFDDLSARIRQAREPEAMVAKPLAGNLVEICYFDFPGAMMPATEDDVTELGLSHAEALALCERNVRAALPPLSSVAKNLTTGSGVLAGDAYSSSYVVLHDDWAPIAAKLHGALLVSVPQSDAVVFVEENGPKAAPDLAHAAANGMKTAQRPISAQVLRWTPSGWDVASP